MAVLQGGKFGHGFAAAGATQAFAGRIDGIDKGSQFSVKRVAAAAVVGGTASKISGGKFANGAVTGAFSRAFNDEMHSGSRSCDGLIFQCNGMINQNIVDALAGFGDTISFGVTDYVRGLGGWNTHVDQGSSAYTAGVASGIVYSTVAGGAFGLRAAGTAGKGLEFSHWIPNRMGGARSLFNGNYVTTRTHALSDPFRYRFMPRSWKALNPMPSRFAQQWVRIPYVYKGAGAGAIYGGASAASR